MKALSEGGGGSSIRTIAEALQRSVGACQRAVSVRAQFQRVKRFGSRPKVTERQKRHIVRSVSSGVGSAKKVKAKLKLDCSVRTVRRVIKSVDWLKYKKRSAAPALTKRHKIERVKWSEQMALMDDVEWCHIIFSDEKKWNLDGPDGMRYNWVDTRRPEQVNVHRHTGGGTVMVWGAFCADRKSRLKFLQGGLDSVKYVATLQTHLQPFIDTETQIFQQDNASCHTSAHTMAWFSAQGIQVLDWPALSPDLNPIENLWGIMTQDVYAGGKQYDSIEALKAAVQAAWDMIPPQTLQK